MTTRFAAVLVLLLALPMALPAARAQQPAQVPAAIEPYDSEKETAGRMTAEESALGFRVPEGFLVQVFAAEPDVRNPIAMTWDPRGRLWIAENYTYAERTQRLDLRLRDRILVFEDKDHDGRPESRTVFSEEVQVLTGLEVGRGGVWAMCPPQLLFLPDRDGDDRPDGPAEVVLDGFTVPAENYHNFANGLRWGPDGWLYGRCGASSPGEIGVPGASDQARVPMRGGLWRVHPVSKRFEALTHGTTNPWGHDWNRLGEAFFINTVNGHLWHAIPGMHLVRPHTIDPNPRAYGLIDQHADHWHWDTTKDWSDSRNVRGGHDLKGGGHAHSGAAIYQADQWPEAYRDRLLTWNFHGRRMNVERLERRGGGYAGRHEPDAFFAADPWFRGIEMSVGPEGSVYAIDWSDTGECHESTGVHRTSGRIFRISHGEPKAGEVPDLAKAEVTTLALLQGHPNEWYVRQSRQVLADRAARGEPVDPALFQALLKSDDPALVLRAVWALNASGKLDRATLRPMLGHPHEAVRAWAVRLLTDDLPLDDVMSLRPVGGDARLPDDLLDTFAKMAGADDSGLVRLVLASTLQRLPADQRLPLARGLAARAEDASDPDIPPMIWYGLIPLGTSDPSALADLTSGSAIPDLRKRIARRLTEDLERRPAPIAALLEGARRTGDPGALAPILAGMRDALAGIRKVAPPPGWDAVASIADQAGDPGVRDLARDLGVVFGDGRALDEVRRVALDKQADLEVRRSALSSLIESRPPDLREVCESLLSVRFLNTTAIRGLASLDDPAIARKLASSYRSFHPSERPAVLDTLASRKTFALALLDEIAAGKIPRGDLSAFLARQIRGLGDPDLAARLAEVWGESRESAADKRELIDRLKGRLTPEALAGADARQGRALYQKHCASCHLLYGQGGQVGPDLTGAGRDNLDYLLENLVDPAATVTADFRMTVVETKDGRVLNGIVRARNDRTLALQTQNEAVTLDRREIEHEVVSSASLMPEGLLGTLTEDEVRDLFAYLMSRTQVPLP